MNKKIELEGAYSSVVNFAMQQNYVPIVKNLVVKNITEEDLNNIDIIISVDTQTLLMNGQ